MQYDMQALSQLIDLPPRYYLSREKGEAAYEHLRRALMDTPEREPLVLLFPPEQLIDASFADEAILRLMDELIAGTHGERALMLRGLTADSLHNLQAVIGMRKRKMALLHLTAEGTWELVGPLERSLYDTLVMIDERGHITAPELAETIASAVNTASNRLKRLYDGRLLWREDEKSDKGLHYVYHVWTQKSER